MKTAENLDKGNLFVKAIIGGVLGVFISETVNITLAEISLSKFFSMVRSKQYFGIIFSLLGCFLCWRVRSSRQQDPRSAYSVLFGCLMAVSGIFCFILEKNWFVGLSPLMKVPLYGVLGSSLSFALTFALVDCINFLNAWAHPSSQQAVIENPSQLLSILFISLATGVIFGIIFGSFDIEDKESYHLQLALQKEEHVCYSFGGVFGIIAGVLVEYFKTSYVQMPGDFTEEI